MSVPAQLLELWSEYQTSFEEMVFPEIIRNEYLPRWWPLPILLYFTMEVCFFIYWRLVIIPYANQIIPPSEYRDYGKDRHKLVLRIMERITRTAKANNRDDLEDAARYLIQWFYYDPPTNKNSNSSRYLSSSSRHKPQLLKPLSGSSLGSSICTDSDIEEIDEDDDASIASSDSSNADGLIATTTTTGDENNQAETNDGNVVNWTVNVLGKDDIDDFMAWGFFGKFVSDLTDEDRLEMIKCYKVLEDYHGIIFKPGRSANYKIRHLLSLEKCEAYFRPLAFYGKVAMMKWGANQLFRLAGFSRYVSKQGVVCWYKPAADDYGKKLLPLLFFHGVGPGGHALYTLMVLLGLNRTGRAIFMFENHSVSGTLNFKAISEQDTIAGVTEMVDRFCPDKNLSLMGHSFGTSALTWLLHSNLRPRIRQMVLLEPVSIMLSESDVIVQMGTPVLRAAVDIVLEHYIRRQFPWYNSELWLEDIPEDVHVIVGLAGKDPIISTPKIRQELEAFCAFNPKIAKNMDFIYWENNMHGMCLGFPWNWREINDVMLGQEMKMMQQRRKLRASASSSSR